MARPTVTSAYLRHEAEQYLIDDAKLWGVLRAAANTIDDLDASLRAVAEAFAISAPADAEFFLKCLSGAAVATEHQENDK